MPKFWDTRHLHYVKLSSFLFIHTIEIGFCGGGRMINRFFRKNVAINAYNNIKENYDSYRDVSAYSEKQRTVAIQEQMKAQVDLANTLKKNI